MAEAQLSVTEYVGTLLPWNFLSGQNTLFLNALGSTLNGVVNDLDGLLSDSDDGVATFDGAPINYVGSGWVQPGISVLGIVLPTGTRKDVVVFESGGDTFFHFPDGPPWATAMIAMVMDVDSSPYQVFTPICFASGTRILTTGGEKPVEDIGPADTVIDVKGAEHPVRWRGGRSLQIEGSIAARNRRPVRIAAGAFGPGAPHSDLWVSQQHRILIQGQWADILFGTPEALAPAVTLVNDRSIQIDTSRASVDYHHILCDRHVALVANGLPCESLSAGSIARDSVDAEVFASCAASPYTLCAPVLKRQEAQLYARSVLAA